MIATTMFMRKRTVVLCARALPLETCGRACFSADMAPDLLPLETPAACRSMVINDELLRLDIVLARFAGRQ